MRPDRRPASLVPALAREVGAERCTSPTTPPPTPARRDRAVVEALPDGVEGVATGTPYAVAPGTVKNGSGAPYKVFTPFSRAWRDVGWDDPVPAPRGVEWVEHDSDQRRRRRCSTRRSRRRRSRCRPPARTPPGAGAKAFLDDDVADYDDVRDDPAADRTSRLSPYLKYGVVHPRQLLAETQGSGSPGARTFDTELCWRDFYADVLHHHPRSAWHDLNPVAALTYDDPGDDVEAWKQGRTGFPIVDAGMRQLLHEGWMHNRVRMITASFLTKDLHVWWPVGRPALPRPPHRRRPGLEQPRLAVGRRHRHRRLALLPRLQPDHPGR